MSSLNSPEGQYLALAGSFQKSQKTLANNFKTWGLKPSSKTQAPTILAATEVAYTSSVKQVEDARNRQILILNEDWVDECCEQKSWIAPEDKHIWEKGGTKESLAETGSTASGEPAGKPTEDDSAKAPNPPPNPPENPPPQPPNPPENPQPQPPNPPENSPPQSPNPPEIPQPQPPIPPENPPKHESDNESMEVALLKKQIEDLKNNKTNGKDGPSDRYDQSEDQKECFDIFYEWSRRFDDTDDPNTNRFEVDCHPADINKPLSDRRKEYEMEIMLITHFRSYVFVIDPEETVEGYDCLRPGYLIPRSDCPAAARKYEDNGGEIVRAKQKENLQGKQMTDFVWWSVATDPEGRFCYCLGAFKGDKRPSLYSRSTFKAKWGKLADDQINEIRRKFSQAELNKQAKARSQKLLKLN
ncbi:hypothetical protein MAC_03287 [Metarhizium acridum CQMa 102]|uniref:BRCT domain-containing protein n=1 Tax=Metarhizium acridum (strain CQMa 102) TaxID=655827 RepID=E9E0A6_METAQ|nr:uncharacterized protein MAC_03287 [Metarhizium acridum CQMa 102]EFY90707.1 hypothetical protein MAC_03287 [Metarhizium acridum CQMa 102]